MAKIQMGQVFRALRVLTGTSFAPRTRGTFDLLHGRKPQEQFRVIPSRSCVSDAKDKRSCRKALSSSVNEKLFQTVGQDLEALPARSFACGWTVANSSNCCALQRWISHAAKRLVQDSLVTRHRCFVHGWGYELLLSSLELPGRRPW